MLRSLIIFYHYSKSFALFDNFQYYLNKLNNTLLLELLLWIFFSLATSQKRPAMKILERIWWRRVQNLD